MPIYTTTGAEGSNTTLVMPAPTNGYSINCIAVSYSAIPSTAGRITASLAGSLVVDLDIPSSGSLVLSQTFVTPPGAEVDFILYGQPGLVGKINVLYTEL